MGIINFRASALFLSLLLTGFTTWLEAGVMESAAWLGGSSTGAYYPKGQYGIQGTTSTLNSPGSRSDSGRFTGINGDLWLFGGVGVNTESNGYLNDLWRFDRQSLCWVWEKGSSTNESSANFGTRGVPHPDNVPGGRSNVSTWMDENGNLWIFGGLEKSTTSSVYWNRNDLWKYEPATGNWTWMSGGEMGNSPGSYGIKNVASATNVPPARVNATTWVDHSGNLWMFGGMRTFPAPLSHFNDVWKYEISTGIWTWIGGSDGLNDTGFYGTQGVEADLNRPPGRTKSSSWTTSTGLYLFGGNRLGGNGNEQNDLWYLSTASGRWTWLRGGNGINQNGILTGSAGIPDPANTPASRAGASAWIDGDGNLWLYGGENITGPNSSVQFDDIWKFNGASWALYKGSINGGGAANYGTKGVENSSNTPGGRNSAAAFTQANYLYLFGGTGFGISNSVVNNTLHDVWRYNISTNQWTWIRGTTLFSSPGVYGTRYGDSVSNTPGSRLSWQSWKGINDEFWIFGGSGYGETNEESGALNDLWLFRPASETWVWMGGSNARIEKGLYGVKGEFSAENVPGVRSNSALWSDDNGNLWLYGGNLGSSWVYSDLWKFSNNLKQWVWLNGSQSNKTTATYGTLGLPHIDNYPGSRYGAARWTDKDGNFWLFGGRGGAASGGDHVLADLWKYDPYQNLWTWVKGSKATYINGNYGVQAVPDSANFPGSRYNANTWVDEQGNLWLFGGTAADSSSVYPLICNDLWRYNISANTWTWMKGSKTNSAMPVYGTVQEEDPLNNPGARMKGQCWSSRDGNLWLFGGDGWGDISEWPYPPEILPPTTGQLADLWRYNVTTNNWTWMKGSSNTYSGILANGTTGVEAESNNPINRSGGTAWSDGDGNGWLYGGGSNLGAYAEYWRYNTNTNNWTWFGTNPTKDRYGVFGPLGVFSDSYFPGSRMDMGYVESPDHSKFYQFGGYGLGEGQGTANDLWQVQLPVGASAASPLWLDSNVIH